RLSRFEALPHTEGCGVSAGSSELLYARTVLGYVTHPLVGATMLLEHGCEKTHNDYFRNELKRRGIAPQRFGWASVQLDGGIDAVMQKVEAWFAVTVAEMGERAYAEVGGEFLRLGLSSLGSLSAQAARALAQATLSIVRAGGT